MIWALAAASVAGAEAAGEALAAGTLVVGTLFTGAALGVAFWARAVVVPAQTTKAARTAQLILKQRRMAMFAPSKTAVQRL